MIHITLGQRVRVSAGAWTAYDETWYRIDDKRESYPNDFAELGYECVQRPEGEPGTNAKCLWRRAFPDGAHEGVIIGRTWRATGNHHPANPYDNYECEPAFLAVDRRHLCYEVALSLNVHDRVLALAGDVEEV